MKQWDDLAESYGLNVLSQKNILWPHLTTELKTLFEGNDVLDVGCGNGSYTSFFHENGSQITSMNQNRIVPPGWNLVFDDSQMSNVPAYSDVQTTLQVSVPSNAQPG